MNKKIKIILIISIIFIINYFVGGIIAANIVLNNIFDHRGSDYSDLSSIENQIYKSIDDYASLSNGIEYKFKSGKNELTGYYYKVESSKGLVISAHGMTSQSLNDDLQYQSYFVENGYSLFAIDLTASGKSEGKSMKGLHQSAYDVKAAYDFLKEEELLENKLILIGHSWGGFGVAASLSLGVLADYVITFSAFDNPYDTMVRYSVNSVGGFIYTTIPTFYMTTSMRYGKNNSISAYKSLNNSDAKALIIHGKADKNIPYNKEALYAKTSKNDKFDNLLLDDIGHSGTWRTKEANKYVDEIEKEIKKLKKDESKLKEYINNIDKDKTSELNPVVFEKINEFLG